MFVNCFGGKSRRKVVAEMLSDSSEWLGLHGIYRVLGASANKCGCVLRMEV